MGTCLNLVVRVCWCYGACEAVDVMQCAARRATCGVEKQWKGGGKAVERQWRGSGDAVEMQWKGSGKALHIFVGSPGHFAVFPAGGFT